MNQPHDMAAERAVLGCVFLRPAIFASLALSVADFRPDHGFVWAAMEIVHSTGAPLDEIAVADAMEAHRLEAIGGLSYLAKLAQSVPTAGNVEYYAAIVRETAAKRRLMLALSETMQAIGEGEEREQIQSRLHAADVAFAAVGATRYASTAERVVRERAERLQAAAKAQHFEVAFLDDYMRGILPSDVIVIGARTGAGKTELVRMIAQRNANKGRRVYMLALEAAPGEIERRIKFSVMSKLVWEKNVEGRERVNYTDWMFGLCDDVTGEWEPLADGAIKQKLATLHTLYKDRDFGVDDLEKRLRELQGKADLIILDHLHYIDSDDSNENRALKSIIKTIRDAALNNGVPIIVVAHLRKKDRSRPALVPDIDDFHGSSDITKIATGVIMLGPARDQPSSTAWISNTYITIPKMRNGGACPYVAMVGYDRRRNSYESGYELGRQSFDGAEIEFLEQQDYPQWAKNRGAR